MSLPTFSELLASLRLSNTGEREQDSEAEASAESNLGLPISSTNHNHTLSSPSSSTSTSSSCIQTSPTQHFPSSSPSIIISHFDHHNHNSTTSTPVTTAAPAGAGTVDPESNIRSIAQRHSSRSIRFTPYLGASKTVRVHIRRSSLPDDLQEFAKPELPHRPSTVSPRLLSSELHLENVDLNTHVPKSSPLPPAPPTPSAPTASSKAIHIDIETHPDVPISSFARRKTPQSSPTMTTSFRQKRRAASFSPVLLPTLLPGLPAVVNQPDVANICEAVATKLSATERPRVVRQQGLRLSSYRSFYISRTKIGAS